MAFDGEWFAEAAGCSFVTMQEDKTLCHGHMDLNLSQYNFEAKTASISCMPEAGATTIYETEGSGFCVTSPAQGDLKPSKPRRRKARMNEVDEETQSRRRAQNRESQQAYRHRREGYIRSLQSQIMDLHLRHREVWQSYYAQDRRLSLLREVAADLTMEVSVLRRRQSQSQQQPAPDRPVYLEEKGDGATIVANDSIYPVYASTYMEGDVPVFSPLLISASTYSTARYNSE